jgi:hypothetical protein
MAAQDQASNQVPQPPFYDPPRPFQFPPPPPPPPRPEPGLTFSAFARGYHFTGPVEGFLPHFGATIGSANAAFMVGYLPKEGLMSLGFEYGRFYGFPLSSPNAPLALGILGPSLDAQVFTDFAHDAHIALGGSVLGFGLSSCNVVKGAVFFVQVRAPYIHMWLPLSIDDRGPDSSHAVPFASFGYGLEAGLVTF